MSCVQYDSMIEYRDRDNRVVNSTSVSSLALLELGNYWDTLKYVWLLLNCWVLSQTAKAYF